MVVVVVVASLGIQNVVVEYLSLCAGTIVRTCKLVDLDF